MRVGRTINLHVSQFERPRCCLHHQIFFDCDSVVESAMSVEEVIRLEEPRRPRVLSLMSICRQELEHDVKRLLLKKVKEKSVQFPVENENERKKESV